MHKSENCNIFVRMIPSIIKNKIIGFDDDSGQRIKDPNKRANMDHLAEHCSRGNPGPLVLRQCH